MYGEQRLIDTLIASCREQIPSTGRVRKLQRTSGARDGAELQVGKLADR